MSAPYFPQRVTFVRHDPVHVGTTHPSKPVRISDMVDARREQDARLLARAETTETRRRYMADIYKTINRKNDIYSQPIQSPGHSYASTTQLKGRPGHLSM